MEKLALLLTIVSVLQFILLNYSDLVKSQSLEVISTQLTCPVDLPTKNERWCYRTTYTQEPPLPLYKCNADIIQRTNRTVKFVDSLDNNIFTEDGIPQTKLWSPNKIQGRNYQPNRYCLYKAACPPGHFMYYTWLDGNFELEPEKDGQCFDYVIIQSFDLSSKKLCGSRPKFVDQRSAPLELTFRSNTPSSTRYPGFRIDVLCVSPFFANLPNCTLLNATDHGVSTNTSTPPSSGRKKRLTTSYIPVTLNSIDVPRDAYVVYANNMIKVVAGGEVLRTFRNIKHFFFWTGFNGTRSFVKGAPKDAYIYGGGNLRVLKYIYAAFYTNVHIPPEFEPSEEAVKVISKLLNATTPFFLADDPLDTEPPTKPQDTRRLLYSKRSAAKVARKHHRRARETGPTGMDKRVDPEALAMAETLENACDVFLREASRSYLKILRELGIQS